MGNIPDAEKELMLETGNYDPTDEYRKIDDSVQVQKYLHELFEREEREAKEVPSLLEQEELNRQFDKNRFEEVLYYRNATVKAKTKKRLQRIETLILNRISILESRTLKGVPILKITVNELRDLLAYVRAKTDSTDKIEEDSNSVDDILKEIFNNNIHDIQLEILKKNLAGENKPLVLTYVGPIGKLRELLKKLKRPGIVKQDVKRVFTTNVRFKQNHHSQAEELTIEKLDDRKI